MALIVPPAMQNTPEQIAGRIQYGQGLQQQAASGAPVGGTGWLQALAHGLEGGIGGYGQYSAEQDRLKEQQRNLAMVAHLTENGRTPTYADMLGLANDPWTSPGSLTVLNELVKTGQPSWKTFTTPEGDVYRYNENDPASQPQLFHDQPPDPQKAATLQKTQQDIEKGKIPEIKSIYDDQGREIKVQWDPKTNDWKQVGGAKISEGWTITTDKEGNTTITQGGKGGKTTESQGKSGNFLTRMRGSSKTIDDLESTMASKMSVKDRWAGDILPPSVAGILKSSDFKRGEQAGREWLTAYLRGDSGGVISPQEETSYGQIYLPQAGDDENMLKQRRAARRRAEVGVSRGITPEQLLAIEQENPALQNPDVTKAPPKAGEPDATVEVP
jgi:hypothetical protein